MHLSKLVLCDMDGTLLDSYKRLPLKLDDVINELASKGIAFGIASGRQYPDLKKQFAAYPDMVIIAENGAIVYVGDKLLTCKALNLEELKMIKEKVGSHFIGSTVIAGLHNAYIEKDIDPFIYQHIATYYKKLAYYENLDELFKNDRIVKVAHFVKGGKTQEAYSLFKDLKAHFNVTIAGENWIDVNAQGVSKGYALSVLKDYFKLSKDDCVVFGDYGNDIAMLKEATYSYAMANALEEVKRTANYICPSNDDNGVLKTLKSLFKLVSPI